MLDYSKVRFLWRGDAGRKVSSGRYEKIYDMGPRAATGDATFATAATRPIVDQLSDWYGLAVDPAASNLVRFSEDFGNAAWQINAGLTKTASGIVAPDDTTTAWTIANTTGVTSLGTSISFTTPFTGDGTKTISLYVYPGTAPFSEIALYDNTAATTRARLRITWATYTVSLVAGAGAVRMYKVKNGWFRIILEANSVVAANTNVMFIYPCGTPSGQIGDVHVWGAQAENGGIATQYKKTTGVAVTTSAFVAPITDAIPVTGTIIMWDNMVNAYNGTELNRVFGSENLSTTFLSMSKDYTNSNQVVVWNHNNTPVYSSNLLWQPTNQRKRWFFAFTFDGSNAKVYRGDVQGNIEKIIDVAYTPTNASIRDMYLNSGVSGTGQIGASYLDILTYDDVLTQAEIQEIFYGTIPIFQQTAYAGDFVDKFRQKVQAEPASTYDNTGETTVRADWSRDIFTPFDDDAAAFYDRGIADGATLENLTYTSNQIIALKALA